MIACRDLRNWSNLHACQQLSFYQSGSRGLLPAPSPLRTVRATFTAHGSSISKGHSCFWKTRLFISCFRSHVFPVLPKCTSVYESTTSSLDRRGLHNPGFLCAWRWRRVEGGTIHIAVLYPFSWSWWRIHPAYFRLASISGSASVFSCYRGVAVSISIIFWISKCLYQQNSALQPRGGDS